jgi:hypothetical protein
MQHLQREAGFIIKSNAERDGEGDQMGLVLFEAVLLYLRIKSNAERDGDGDQMGLVWFEAVLL